MDSVEQLVKPRYILGRRGALPIGDVARPNKQLFTAESQTLNDQEASPECYEYFNSKQPNLVLLSEQPVHRTMIAMRVNGATLAEIAQELNYTIPHISQVLRQPWAKKRMLEIQRDSSIGVLTRRIESIGVKALNVIEEILDNSETPANVKSTTAQYAVNRLLGRPTDSIIINDNRSASDLSNAELENIIAKELAKSSSAVSDDILTSEIVKDEEIFFQQR